MFRVRTATAALCVLSTLMPHLVAAQTAKQVIVTIETKPAVGEPFVGVRPAVDVAILLDTSNSMDGLIRQAKNQLWTIVQQFARAKREGKTPHLRVSLFEYGNTNLPASEGYLRQVLPLTDDLDALSEALFALTTSGGDEYCGQVIDKARKRLDWCAEPNTYQAIFIAGNEPFTQGSVDYRESCQKAIQAGIIVNTIHCGDRQAGIQGQWQDGASLAEGKFFNINQDKSIVHIDCPQDKIILELNAHLNRTYLWYGTSHAREVYAGRQAAQDDLAAGEGASTATGRAAAKATGLYRNAARDLVDRAASDPKALSELPVNQLPEEMQSMNEQQRKAHVKKLAAERRELQSQIAKLAREREAYLVKKQGELVQAEEGATLGDAIVAAVAEQLTTAGFSVDP